MSSPEPVPPPSEAKERPARRSKKRVFVAALLLLLAGGGGWFWSRFDHVRRESQDKSVSSFQISYALPQFMLDNPTRLFVRYEDLIGPNCLVKGTTVVNGEDYHELFPMRFDCREFAVTMKDGRRVIVFVSGERRVLLHQRPDGSLRAEEYEPTGVSEYERWRQEQRRPDGPLVIATADFRLETTFRGGVPDGPFRYFRPDGKLWAEGTYRQGRVVAPYREYDLNGKVEYETAPTPNVEH